MVNKKSIRLKAFSLMFFFFTMMPIVAVSAADGEVLQEESLKAENIEAQTEESVAFVSESETAIISTTLENEESITEVDMSKKTKETSDISKETNTQKSNLIPSTTVNHFYDEDDLYVLSHLIYGESGGESDKCQIAVGSVVLNRVKSKYFPNTIKDVAFAKGQYACTWDGNFDKTPDKRAIENARYLLENGSQLPDGVVFQAGFKQGRVYDVIDGVYFCYGKYY